MDRSPVGPRALLAGVGFMSAASSGVESLLTRPLSVWGVWRLEP